jgi:hypothetical protein
MDIEISAFKKVILKIPGEFTIMEIQQGMDENFFRATIKDNNVIVLEAMPQVPLPPTNMVVICEQGLFNANISLNNGTTRYFYDLKKEFAILFDNPSRKEDKPKQEEKPNKPQEISTENVISEFTFNELYGDTSLMRVPLESFRSFNAPFGKTSSKIELYVNNIIATDTYNYISVVVVNNSNQLYDVKFVKFFLKEKVKKSLKSIETGENLIISTLVNNPRFRLEPEESTLLVYEFDRFTVDNDNSINLICAEKEGTRTVDLDITGVKFNSSTVFYKEE